MIAEWIFRFAAKVSFIHLLLAISDVSVSLWLFLLTIS
jgi:hypothetical protein